MIQQIKIIYVEILKYVTSIVNYNLIFNVITGGARAQCSPKILSDGILP